MCFLVTSIKFFYFLYIDASSATEYTGHTTLGVAAVLCLLVFVAPLMVLCLFYHLKIFQWCLTWCNWVGQARYTRTVRCLSRLLQKQCNWRQREADLYLLFRFCFIVSLLSFCWRPLLNYLHTILIQINIQPIQYNSIFCLLSVSEAFLSLLMAGLVVILQPYKKLPTML